MSRTEYRPWVGERWHVSRYNSVEEVRAQLSLSENMMISDCTLREGEQQPGVVFRKNDKLRLAYALDEIGIPELEVGMLAVSEEERETVKAMVKAGLRANIRAVCRAMKTDVDMAVDCGLSIISVSLPVGYLQLEKKLMWSEEKTLERLIEITNYAHDQGLYVVVSPMDTPRTNCDFFKKYLKTIVTQGHADRIRLVDTVGAAMPLAIRYLVGKMIASTHLPIEVHCHNDFGLGTASTLAGIEAGASVASTSLNGMGERGGLAATEEVALALSILYGVDLRLKYENLYQASLFLQKLSKVKVQKHKPVIGENAFAQESGIAVGGWIKEPFTAVSYLPEVVGHSSKVILGKGSGKDAIKWKLKEIGTDVTDEQVAEILAAVKRKAERTKSFVPDGAFAEICEKVLTERE